MKNLMIATLLAGSALTGIGIASANETLKPTTSTVQVIAEATQPLKTELPSGLKIASADCQDDDDDHDDDDHDDDDKDDKHDDDDDHEDDKDEYGPNGCSDDDDGKKNRKAS